MPSRKLIKQWREGARWRRKHDRPQTAYQRLLQLGVLSRKKAREWRDQDESPDPFQRPDELEQQWRPILAKTLEVI